MSSFKIDFGADWKALRKSCDKDTLIDRITPDVVESILNLHTTLEARVDSLFNVKDKLTTVLIGKNVEKDRISKTFIRYNLQYRFKPVPLSDYKFNTTIDTNNVGLIPFRVSPTFVRRRPAPYSTITTSSISKGRSFIPTGGKASKMKGFVQMTPSGRIAIFARTRSNTWKKGQEPSYTNPTGFHGRTKLKLLFAPSLSSLALTVFEVDKDVAKAKDRLIDDIALTLTRTL